ncbi:cyclic pyranopterin monophosphate synthase [bacterium BMS3Abin07]|nr:cyclic pyranopterin monophosphate synthase [bacterium BMS3Abin07]GBE32369.1 cyclic pyranopterin monophosphate synthase [bacterium BMS3Bbin05]
MRVSVTDRCNLRCVYCMPPGGVRQIVHKEILRYEEIARIVGGSAELGVRKIRITGGEPLARKNIQALIRDIRSIDGIEDLSLTTNGILLEKYAAELKDCGLDRVNVSLDTLKAERYTEITRGGDFGTVMRGIEEALRCGLGPVKINVVPIRGLNDDEVLDFARLTVDTPYHVRFIEFMPVGDRAYYNEKMHIPTDEIKSVVESLGELKPVKLRRNGPAKYYKLPGGEGVIGFISAMTHHFCRDCNRLRLTSDGKLRPCLFSETEIDLKAPMRRGAPDEEIRRLLRLAIEAKPEGHYILGKAGKGRSMSAIGG